MTTLVFPSSTPHGEQYILEAINRGEPVVAASSIANQASVAGLTNHYLPTIHEDDFYQALTTLMDAHDVDRVFVPVTLAYVHLRDLIKERDMPLKFVALPPFYEEIERQKREVSEAEEDCAYVREVMGLDEFLEPHELAALLRASFNIFGESYRHKLVALAAATMSAPAGDFVEIGALYGRSCSVIVQALKLAGRRDPVLAIDAWQGQAARQHSLSTALANAPMEVDWSVIADSFDTNLLPLAGRGQFNRLPMASQPAHAEYVADRSITTDRFGTTTYSGAIGLLHIDANHDYEAVKLDRDLWCGHVAPGGWIIFDDYAWRYGTGPGLAADEFCAAHANDITRCFFLDGALFIKLAG